MDAGRFDDLVRRLSSRRTALGGLVAGLLVPLEAVARGNHHHKDRHQKKHKHQNKKQKEDCWRGGNCLPHLGANLSRCNLEGSTAFTGVNCTGCNISRANLRGAKARGANFAITNFTGACLVDADFTGATFAPTTNLRGAIFCRTIMPNGDINNTGCAAGIKCCPTCIDLGNPCGDGISGPCCGNANCVHGKCQACTPATCQSLGKSCGEWPDGCGGTLQCGSCPNGLPCNNGTCAPCHVCASGCPYSEVQAAIDAASEGATIFICSGQYRHPVGRGGPVADIRKNLTLVGMGQVPEHTELNGRNNQGSAVYIDAGHVELRNLSVIETYSLTEGLAGGIIIANGEATLTRVSVTDNAVTDGGGIVIHRNGKAILKHAWVSRNSARFGGGVYNAGVVEISADTTIGGNDPFECIDVDGGRGCYS